MAANSVNSGLPSFSRKPGGMLSKTENDVADKASEQADKAGVIGDDAGGVIPAQDYDALYAAGAKGIFGPGTPIQTSAREVLKQIRAARKA